MRRRVPLLVLIYVTLDFANPLMPGAVSFEGGSVEVVPGDRTARVGVSAMPAAVSSDTANMTPGERPVVRLAPVPVSSRQQPFRLARRLASEPSEAPAPSPEDH
jgi:hypothetical protein